MPQQKKEAVRAAFVRAARQAFADHGFADTSLRDVAAAAGGSLGNLRNYFPSKDELFAAACEPVPADLKRSLHASNSTRIPPDSRALLRHDRAIVELVASYIITHRESLELLLQKSHGSSLQGWADELFEAYVALELRRIRAFSQAEPEYLARLPSKHLVRGICRMYFDLAADFVRRRLGTKAFLRTLAEYDEFRRAGLSPYLTEDP